jgi:hypothetical protein
MVSQSKVLAYMKKLHFCKVTPVSIQTFVEGLLRLANVLEATNGTLKNVNVVFNVIIGKDFGLKNSVFYIRTVLTENNMFLCIFSFTVFIVNEYFTTVTKLRICAHHL